MTDTGVRAWAGEGMPCRWRSGRVSVCRRGTPTTGCTRILGGGGGASTRFRERNDADRRDLGDDSEMGLSMMTGFWGFFGSASKEESV